MIEAHQASLVYDDHGREIHACRAVDLKVRPGEFLGILGPSGSGKSSLLYLLSGLKEPTSGEITWEGQSLSEMPREVRSRQRLERFGFVFQQSFLIGYLSARENVALAGPGDPDELLDAMGLAEMKHRRPHELSGGQRQRVCVARALIGGRQAVFADEPTAALDHDTGLEVMRLLAEHRGDGALVVVTHDPTMLSKADRVVEIGEGRLVKG